MLVKSVNSGEIATIVIKGKPVRTAILKRPVAGTARIARLGIEGDRQADPRFHGGPAQALNVYPGEHYPYWEERLGIEMPGWGIFGENLTTEGLFETEVCIGDILRVGSARTQVTKPRAPCYKMEGAIGVAGFEKMANASGRTGFYLRVLEEGEVRAGDPLIVERRDPAGLTIRAAFAAMMGEPGDPEMLRRGLEAEGLAPGLREKIAKAIGQPKTH